MIVAGIATLPTRQETFREAVRSILPQVDRLFVFFDRFDVPIDIRHRKIVALRSQDFGDLRGGGKFLGLLMCHGPTIFFGIDDDIAYPPDYVPRMAAFLTTRSRPAVVGVHATFIKADIVSYARDRRVADRIAGVTRPLRAHVLGTDSIAFDTTALRFDVRTWQYLNMSDLQFALTCARAGLPRIVIPRQPRWLRSLARDQSDSIHAALKRDDSVQTALARELLQIGGSDRPGLPNPSVRQKR